jgi:hypothetical protein
LGIQPCNITFALRSAKRDPPNPYLGGIKSILRDTKLIAGVTPAFRRNRIDIECSHLQAKWISPLIARD